jgi:hypothetical protein
MNVMTYARKPQATSAVPALKIGRPDDAFEHEADRVADEVMSGTGIAAQWSLSRMSIAPPLQRKPAGYAPAHASRATVDEGLQSSSPPLDAETRGFMESRFGHDFGRVKIHSDEAASRSALSLGARSYTVGDSIIFSSGSYSPQSADGRRLLAHELAHVVQQGGRDSMVQRSPLDESKQPAPTGSAKGYQYTVDGKTVTLTEEQYKAEVARETHNMLLDFRRVSDLVDVYRDSERDFINNIHGTHWYSVGSISDFVGGADLPDESIWLRPAPAILAGTRALLNGDLALAGRMLPVAQAALKSSIHEWNTYMNATIEGAGSTVAALETTRDVSFSIAIGTAAVVALPAVAAGAAAAATGVGATGAAATVLTGVGTLSTITAGGAAVGGLARAGTSAAGQALAGDKVRGSEVWKEFKEGARHGAVDAATAVATAGTSKALAPGRSLVTKALKAGASGAAGGGLGSATDATLQGKSPKEIAAATAKGAVGGFAGGAVGGAGQHLLGEGTASRVVSGVAGGTVGGGTAALLSGEKSKDTLSAAITSGLAGGVAASAEPPQPKASPGSTPPKREPVSQSSSQEPTAASTTTDHAPPQPEARPAEAATTAARQSEAQAAEPVKAAPAESETAPSPTPDEQSRAPSDKEMQAAKASAKAARNAAARLKREAQRREQEELRAAEAEDRAIEESDIEEAQQKRDQSKEESKKRAAERRYSHLGNKETPGTRASRRVLEMSRAAAAGEYVNLSLKNKNRLLREFKAAVRGADARQLPKIKNKMTADFDEALRTPSNRRVGDPQSKHVAGMPGEFFDLPTGQSSYAQPDYSVQIETPQGGRVRAHVNLKAHNLTEITPAQGRAIAGKILNQARRNAFHLPNDEPIIISFAEMPPHELQIVIKDRLLVPDSPIVEVRFGSVTHRR